MVPLELLRFATAERFFALPQASDLLAAFGKTVSERQLRRLLAGLESGGWLKRGQIFARPLLDLSAGPLACWRPGQADPDYNRLAWQVEKRWVQAPHEQTVWFATGQALAAFGFTGQQSRWNPFCATHELHVAAMHLAFLREHSDGQWMPEREMHRCGWKKIPDAAIRQGDTVIEVRDFAGNYPLARLQAFGSFFKAQQIPFSLW